jgi:diguanylate cyclase (GGDEF)-like protein
MSKLLTDIAASSYDYEDEGQTRSIRFTASVGVTEFDHRDADEDLIRRADEALYDAKRKGKNRVIVKKRSVFGRLFHG